MRYFFKRRNLPKSGDTRIKSGFLFFPKFVDNEVRWLTFASWQDVCCFCGSWNSPSWFCTKFVD